MKGDEIEVLIFTSSLDKEIRMFKYDGNTEQINIFNGHTSSVISLEVMDINLISLDVEGFIRKWNFNGDCIGVYQTEGIKCIAGVSDNLLLVSDRNKIYLYDYVKDEIVKDIVDESGMIKKHDKGYILFLKDRVILLDNNLVKGSCVTVNGDRAISGCVASDGSLLVGAYQQIHRHGKTQMNMKAHSNVISCMEMVEIHGKEVLVSGCYEGEVKLWYYKV